MVWMAVAWLAGGFTAGIDLAERPLLPVVGLLAAGFILYLASLARVWHRPPALTQARTQLRVIVMFALVFRLTLWWTEPIQEVDLYRYLWDGRAWQAGVNPYRYSPAQVDAARESTPGSPEMERLVDLLRRSPEVASIFSRIEHRGVATIYPPLSQAVFAATAWLTPERASVETQVRGLKGILLTFDLATIGFVLGLLINLGQPPGRVLAYAWCPLVLKEFANSGHLDSIAVGLTAAALWLLTLPRSSNAPSRSGVSTRALVPSDWLAAGLWAGAVLAKLYPLVLAPVLLSYWWRWWRWRSTGLVALFALIVIAGYLLLPGRQAPTPPGLTTSSAAASYHTPFSGLGEFLRRWEMNDLLFSVLYENVRPRREEMIGADPWYSVMPAAARERFNAGLQSVAEIVGFEFSGPRLAFLFTQIVSGVILLAVAGGLALRGWPDDHGEALLRRAFLCLAWLWFLSATQNPWYWTWAMPLVVFASRPWLLVSGFALIYYLRFWFIAEFPEAILPGGLNGRRFFDEVVVWVEHLPALLLVLVYWVVQRRTTQNSAMWTRSPGSSSPNV